MRTKTEQAILLLRAGDYASALAIIKTFRAGFTKDEKRCVEIASETLSGHGSFYEQIGIDTSEQVRRAKAIVTEKYLHYHEK